MQAVGRFVEDLNMALVLLDTQLITYDAPGRRTSSLSSQGRPIHITLSV